MIPKLSTHNVHLRRVSPAKASEVLSTISVTVRAAMQEPPGSLGHTMLENRTGPGVRAADKSRSGRTMTPSTHIPNYREAVTDFLAPGLGQLVLENQSASELSSIISCWSEMPDRVSLCHPGWSAVAQSWLTVTSTSWVPAILLPEPPRFYVNCAVRRERVDAALSDEFLLPTDREIPGGEATRVAGATLLAGVAVLPAPSAAFPGVECAGRTGSAGPIPTRKTAIGSAEDGEFHSGRSEPGKRGTGVRQRKTKKQKNFITWRREIQNGRVAAARDCGSR
ncbi:putative uncharacterized protein SPANXA2-OT1 [Plecturocebus cupreus]